ncbi:MAG: nitroreductase family protein [Acidimicrobiia bacterium]
MATWDAIRARRNVRQFSERPIQPEDLDRILEAGRLTPSASNWQPWDFVVVTDSERLTELAAVWRGAWHVADSPAAVAIVTPEVEPEREKMLHFDVGQAVMSLMLAAADLGIGAGHAHVEDQELARTVLGFPADRLCTHLISFGYPADRPLRPRTRVSRRPFDEVVHRDVW